MTAKLEQGLSQQQVARDLGCASLTVVKAAQGFAEAGVENLFDHRAFNGVTEADPWVKEMRGQVQHSEATQFSWQWTPWPRELLHRELEGRFVPPGAPCTMGRTLAAIVTRLKMPKPTLDCRWKAGRGRQVFQDLLRLARSATAEDPVFFKEEMYVQLNPRIGRDWMAKGVGRYVRTPSRGRERFVAGALNTASGKLTWVDAHSKSTDLACALVFKAASEHRYDRRVRIFLGNDIIHSRKRASLFLDRLSDWVVLHCLPAYCVDNNRIERWRPDLPASAIRNHGNLNIKNPMVQANAFMRPCNQQETPNTSPRLGAGVFGLRSFVQVSAKRGQLV